MIPNTMRLLLLATLVFAALAGTAQARPHLRDCAPADTEFYYHVQQHGTDCATARRVARNTIVDTDGTAYGPSAFWACRVLWGAQGIAQDALRIKCVHFGDEVRFTSRAF
jgi:hypothetical protein